MTRRPRTPEQILAECAITRPEDIDLEAIAWLEGAKVVHRNLDGCEARIHGSAKLGRAMISIQVDAYEMRQRFSVGHELGHWEHHRGQNLMCQKQNIGGSGRRSLGGMREQTANGFAAGLLMPEGLLKPRFREAGTLNMRVVEQLASAFRVSRTAMAYRLIELDYMPGLLVCHSAAGRRWFKRSPSIHDRWFPSRSLDPHSNAYDILHSGAENDRYASAIPADAWFDVPWADQIEVREQSFRGAEGEVVSLLIAIDGRML